MNRRKRAAPRDGDEAAIEKAIADAELALEILQHYQSPGEARRARKEWGMYDYLGQEEEDSMQENDDDDFNLSDTDVAGNMTSEEATAAIRLAFGTPAPYPHKQHRDRLMADLRASVELLTRHRA